MSTWVFLCVCACVCVSVCVHACVCILFNMQKVERRPLPSPSQDRDPEVSRLYGITVKWLRTRVGNPCTDTLTHSDTQLDTDTHAETIKAIPQHAQIRLPSRFWILFLMLLVSTSPHSCSGGACANAHTQARLNSNPNPNPASYIKIDALSLYMSQKLSPHPSVLTAIQTSAQKRR